MRVLVVTNMFPTQAHPSGGVFVSRRLDEHRAAGLGITAFALRTARGPLALRAARWAGKADQVLPHDSGFCDVPVLVSVPATLMSRRIYVRAPVHAAAEEVLGRVQGKYDVIHAHGMYGVPAGAVAQRVAAALDVPYVVTVHGTDVHTLMPSRRAAYAAVLRGASRVAYVSQALRRQAVDLGAPHRNSVVIPNGVDCEVFRPTGRVDARGERGPVVGFIGNLLPVKGADRLPSIFAEVAGRVPGVRFLIVGSGPLRAKLESALVALPVTFTGNVEPSRVPALIHDVDVVVLPSRQEGWGCVVLEAHACETPVLVSDAGGLPESVGDPSFVVPNGAGFEARFAARLAEVLKQPTRPSGLRRRAMEYSWTAIATRERDMLDEAVTGA